MKIQELLAALLLAESNFKVMHWKYKGDQFDNYHKEVTSDYYTLCSDQADIVAEIIMRLDDDEDPLNYSEVLEVIDDSDNEYLIVDSDSYYSKEDVVKNTDNIFSGILKLIESILQEECIANNIRNVGIKSSLESMYETFDLQYRYINARRM